MNYEEFQKNIVDNIKDYLPDKYQDAKVDIHQVAKMNDQNLDGITILAEGSNVSPNIYLNSFFEDYLNGRDMDDILSTIADIRLANEQEFNMNEVKSWENVKDKIMPVVCCEEDNTQRLSDMPYTKVEDLAVTYQISFDMGNDVAGSIPITNNLMEMYGVTVEDLHQMAVENVNQENGIYFRDMRDTMVDIMLADMPPEMTREEAEAMFDAMMPQEEDSPKMYVLSNESRVKGASAILNDDIRQMIAEQVGGDFFVLPSSIHECLIVPKDSGMSYEELQNMVQEINATQVAPEERLSDYVYEYDAENHDLQRSDWKEERENNREKPARDEKVSDIRSEKSERPSLKEKLEAKKIEAASAGVEKLPGKEHKKEATIA